MNRKRNFMWICLTFGVAGLLIALLMVSFTVSQAASPQSSATIDPNKYVPMQVGNRWIYSWTNTAYNTSPIIETVVVSEVTNNEYTLYAHYRQEGLMEGQFVISTSVGIDWISYGTYGSVISPLPVSMYTLMNYLFVPTNLFPQTLQIGDSWSGTGRYGSKIYTGTKTLVTDTIQILLAGRLNFDCIGKHPL